MSGSFGHSWRLGCRREAAFRDQGADGGASRRVQGRAAEPTAKRAAEAEQIGCKREQLRHIGGGERTSKAYRQAMRLGLRHETQQPSEIEMSEKRA